VRLGGLRHTFPVWYLSYSADAAHYAFYGFYKMLWLVVVAYPLWKTDTLKGSPGEELAGAFILVVVPLVFIPWKYVFQTYVMPGKGKEEGRKTEPIKENMKSGSAVG